MVCRLQCRERKRYFASVKKEKKMLTHGGLVDYDTMQSVPGPIGMQK